MEKEKKTPAAIELKNAGDENKKEITPGMIRRVSITVGKREIPLRYSLRTQVQMEEELEMDYTELMTAIRKKKNTMLIVRMLRILGNAGLQRAGLEADLTDDWLMDHILPMNMAVYRTAAIGAMTKGWYMENEEANEEEQDEILAEIRKKNGNTE